MLALVAHQNEFSKDAATLLEAVLEASPGYRAARHDYVLALIALHRHTQAREHIAILIAAYVTQDGESNWFEGLQLLAVYVVLALTFLYA